MAKDYAKAREWYEKAADKGDAKAMNNLGLLYDNGQGVAQDYAKAASGTKRPPTRAAKAMTDLGLLYNNGTGVARDYAKAREWYKRAADKGDKVALEILQSLSIRETAEAGRLSRSVAASRGAGGQGRVGRDKT